MARTDRHPCTTLRAPLSLPRLTGARGRAPRLPPACAAVLIGIGIHAGTGLLPQTRGMAHAQTVSLGDPAARSYSIPAGPLGTSLAAFASQTGLLLSFDPALTQGLEAPGLIGDHTASEGLGRLLGGSGLEVVPGREGSYTLRRAPKPVGPQSGTLPVVVVNARAHNNATEGTGSYAAGHIASSTATPLGLTIMETPQSISIVTREQLEDQNLLSLGQAARHVTGIATAVSDIERTDIHARGFHVDNYQYDGVPTHHGNDFFGASTFDSAIYDRIEFVRGATGLMTGAGNPGAAINLVRKRATSRTLAGEATLGLGSWQRTRGSVDLSTPLNETGTVRARLSAALDHHEAFMDRYQTKNNALLATVEADLTPTTNLRVGIVRQAKRPKDVDWGGLPMFSAQGQASHWPRDFNSGAGWTYWNTTNTTTYIGLDHRFSNRWEIKVDVSRLKSDFESKLLYLLGRADPATGLGISPFANYSIQDFRQTHGSVQVRGPFELLGRKHEVALGVTHSKSVLNAGNHPSTAAPIGDIYAWDGSYPEPIWGAYRQVNHDVTKQTGLYGAVRFALTDSLKLIAGARHSQWRLDTLSEQRRHSVVTPYAGLVWDLNASYALYASYTDIFQPQAYRNSSGGYLDPVVGKSYEAGLKAALLDGRLNAAFAVFKINQDNVAVLDGDALIPGTTDRAYRGERGASSKGFEAQISGQFHPSWNWVAGFSRTLASNAEGAPLNSARPVNQLHAFSAYQLPGALSPFKIGGGVRWQSGIYQVAELPTGMARRDQGSFAIADLMFSYRIAKDWSAQLNVENLFDKTYTSFAGNYFTYGRPRNAMLTIRYRLPG